MTLRKILTAPLLAWYRWRVRVLGETRSTCIVAVFVAHGRGDSKARRGFERDVDTLTNQLQKLQSKIKDLS